MASQQLYLCKHGPPPQSSSGQPRPLTGLMSSCRPSPGWGACGGSSTWSGSTWGVYTPESTSSSAPTACLARPLRTCTRCHGERLARRPKRASPEWEGRIDGSRPVSSLSLLHSTVWAQRGILTSSEQTEGFACASLLSGGRGFYWTFSTGSALEPHCLLFSSIKFESRSRLLVWSD